MITRASRSSPSAGLDVTSDLRHGAVSLRPNRDDLLGGVVEFVLDEIDDPVAGDDWRATLEARARNFRQTILRHVNVAPLIAAQALTAPASSVPSKKLRSVDTVLTSLKRAGFSATDAVLIYRLVTSFTLGHIATQLQPCAEASTLDPLLSGPDECNVVELRPSTTSTDDPAEFDVGLAVLLDGIVSQVPRT